MNAPKPDIAMLSRIVTFLILVPVAVILIALAVANRQPTTLTLDVIDQSSSVLEFTLPLSIWLLIALILGIVVGGVASWLSQHRYRSLARKRGREVRRLEKERAPDEKKKGPELQPIDWPYGRDDGTDTGITGRQLAGLPAPSGTSRA